MVSTSGDQPTQKAGSEGLKAPNRDESLIAAFERLAARRPSRNAAGSKLWEPAYRSQTRRQDVWRIE
jgi:hypothetical protein